jgi:hypothetical protein
MSRNTRRLARRIACLPALLGLMLVNVGWYYGSDSNSVVTQVQPDQLYVAQTGAGVVEIDPNTYPSQTPTAVCGNAGHNPGDVGYTVDGNNNPTKVAANRTYEYVWLFGPASAPYGASSNPNWSYIWGEQQADAAWREWNVSGVSQWYPYLYGLTIFADIEDGSNIMCGANQSGSGWYLDAPSRGDTGQMQQNTNVIEGFLARIQAVSGVPGGLYWKPRVFNRLTRDGIWPNTSGQHVYWQAGGCSPITAWCGIQTTSNTGSAESQFSGHKSAERVTNGDNNRIVIWQYNYGTNIDYDLTSQQTADEPLQGCCTWFRPNVN